MTKKIFLYLKEKGKDGQRGWGVCIVHCWFPYVLSVMPLMTYGSWTHHGHTSEDPQWAGVGGIIL